MFDFVTYMRTLHGKLKATKTAYTFTRVSGTNDLEEVLENTRRKTKYFVVDDSQDGITFRGAGGSFFERRAYTIYLLVQTTAGNMDTRETILTQVREIFRSLMSRLIKDKLTIPVVDFDRVSFFEVPPTFGNGSCGIYFTFYVQNPVDLKYDGADWTD